MTNTLVLIKRLRTSPPNPKRDRIKPRRVRRQEARNRIRTAKSQRKAG